MYRNYINNKLCDWIIKGDIKGQSLTSVYIVLGLVNIETGQQALQKVHEYMHRSRKF